MPTRGLQEAYKLNVSSESVQGLFSLLVLRLDKSLSGTASTFGGQNPYRVQENLAMPLDLRQHTQQLAPRIWSIFWLITGLCLGDLSFANPGLENPLDSRLLAQMGTPVASMPNASAIQDWTAEDSFHMVVQIAQASASQVGTAHVDVYRFTFTEACYNLRWASSVGLSGSQDQVWAGFDYLTADGQRCSIGAIDRL
jgi:hypothetical protein